VLQDTTAIELPPPALRTIDLKGKLAKNGLRKALWTVRQYRKLADKMPLTLLVLGRWRSVSFIGLKSKFISQVLLCSGEIELMNQVEFPCAALLELTD
jgi:hypothetical protein